MKKRVTILGSTGSVGTSTVDVIEAFRRESGGSCEIEVVALTANRNVKLLAEQAVRLGAGYAAIGDASLYGELRSLLDGTGIETGGGEESIMEAASRQADWTMAGIVGMAGLRPLMESLRHGNVVAVANKEPLVAAGPLVIAETRKSRAKIVPVDSEHNAIFQVFDEGNRDMVRRLLLTASGGPFRTWSRSEMAKATPEQAVAHPNWSMGRKISVDSATMMNKALEVIEARYLFDMPPSKIEVLVHPESVVHSMVEYEDGSVLAQLGAPDMRTPIACAFAWPRRMKTPGRRLDFETLRSLTFEKPDVSRFPAIGMAYSVLESGPYACVAMNAANEVAVGAFLAGRTGFNDIVDGVDDILQKIDSTDLNSIDDAIRLDNEVRRRTESRIIAKAA